MLKLLGGRKGGATRGGKGGSHVHKEGKRLSDKAIRKHFEEDPYTWLDWAQDDIQDPDEGDR